MTVTTLPEGSLRPWVKEASGANISVLSDENVFVRAIYPALRELVLVVLSEGTTHKMQINFTLLVL